MHKYIVIDDFISTQDTDDLMDLIDDIIFERYKCECDRHELQTIIESPNLTFKIWKEVKDKVSELALIKRNSKTYKLIGLSDSITLSKHNTPIGIHRDAEGKSKYNGVKYGNLLCFYKIGIYLNDVNEDPKSRYGGTILYDDNEKMVDAIIPKKRRALIFDIRDLHSGAPIPEHKTKYMVGFRLLYKEI